MSKNGKVWKKNTKESGGVVGRKTRVTKPVSIQAAQFGSQKMSCVLLRYIENQYTGVIEGDQKILVVSDFYSNYQPKKNGWYLCLTPKYGQKPFFFYNGEPVYKVEIFSIITSWKSSVNSKTVADYRSLSPNDLFEKENTVLFFGENSDHFVWIKDPKERTTVLQNLNRREQEIMCHRNPWTKEYGLILSPYKIVGSSLDEREVIEIIFG